MRKQSSILLVEGVADKNFFEHLCRKLHINSSVIVSSPRDFGGNYDTKGAIFNTLPTLLDQMADGHLIHLAAIVDSDAPQNGGGQVATLDRFASLVGTYGFDQRHKVGEGGGFLFHHVDGLSPVGLWLMPDNKTDGTIEDFVKASLVDSQRARFANAATAVAKSERPFAFKPTHLVKAEIATWMAWQKVPGQGIFACVRDELVDLEKDEFKRLILWLQRSFPSPAPS